MAEQAILRYRVEAKIGTGSTASVYLAQDRLSQQFVALKVLKTTNIPSGASLSLAHEFQMMASLRHPHIVSVRDYGFTLQKAPYFTMDYLPNTLTLSEAGHNRSVDKQIELILQVLEALAYLHRHSILHNDLKPSNLLVVHDKVKLVDFGFSRRISEVKTEQMHGTLAYSSPEQLRKHHITPVSEQFSVGLMVYEMLNGDYPFPLSPAISVVNGIMNTDLDFTTFGLPDEVVAVLQRLVMKDPGQRYPSVQTAINDLRTALNLHEPEERRNIRESYLQAASFIGRQSELDQLQSALIKTKQGQSQVWILGGESGVGKSRLADEIRTNALIQGFEVFRGQAVEGGGLPFQPWREPVRRLLLSRPVDDLQAGILKEIVPDIEHLLDRSVTPISSLDGPAHQERLTFSIIDLLRHQRDPTLLLLEDLQWVTESLEVIKQLLRVLDQLPNLMVLGTYRHDERPDLPQQVSGVHILTLDRLQDDEVSKLSQAMLGDQGADPQLVSALTQETEGNTFFIVETIRTWAEEAGHLQQIGAQPVSTNILTNGMQALLQRRIQQVPHDDQKLLKLAAVGGRQLDLSIIESLARQNVSSWLQRVSDAAIVTIIDGQWQFTHDKLRETILQELTDEDRRTSHRDVAEAIEQVHPDNPDYYPILLELWHQADDVDKEIYYLIPVAEKLIRIIADYEYAQSLLDRGSRILPHHDRRLVPIWNWLSLSHMYQGHYEETHHLAQQALVLANSIDDQPGKARSTLNLAYVTYQRGDHRRALEFFQTSLGIYNALGDQHGTATILDTLAVIESDFGHYAQASEFCLQSLTISQDIGDLRSMADSQNILGIIAYRQGDFKQASEFCLQSLTISQDIGDLRNTANALSMLGLIRARQGAYSQGCANVEQSISILQKIGDQHQIGYSIGTLGVIESFRHNYTKSSELLEQSVSIFQTNNNQHGIANSLTYLGFVHLKSGTKQAQTAFVKALVINQENQYTPFILRTLLGFAWIYLRNGKATQAANLSGLVRLHPVKDFELQLRLDELMDELEQALDPIDLQAALEQGEELDLETIVHEILAHET